MTVQSLRQKTGHAAWHTFRPSFSAKSWRKLCPRSCNINAVIYNLHANSQCFRGDSSSLSLSSSPLLSFSLPCPTAACTFIVPLLFVACPTARFLASSPFRRCKRKNISSAKINCPGLAWACSKQIYLVPRFMSLHYETYTHPDRPLPPIPSSWDRCLSLVVAHLVEQLNKLLLAGLASTGLTFLLLWQPSLFSKWIFNAHTLPPSLLLRDSQWPSVYR